MATDLDDVRMASDDELARCAYRASSAVGLMLAPLLGVRGPEAEHRVVDLGVGLQVSNILCGVEADARKGRVYLPETRLRACGLCPDDVLEAPRHPRLVPVLRGLADLARRYYASAELGAAFVPIRYRHGVILLGRACGALGERALRPGGAPTTPGGLSLLPRLHHFAALAVIAGHPRVLGRTTARCTARSRTSRERTRETSGRAGDSSGAMAPESTAWRFASPERRPSPSSSRSRDIVDAHGVASRR
jgi:hypothetical protein